EVSIYTRTKEKADEVIEEGAIWCDTVAECAKEKDVVITIVGYPKDVEEVYFGEAGIIANAKEGAYLIDMTTTSPKLSSRIYEEAKAVGKKALDAPVSGGDTGAKNGTLSIMVGGDKEDFDACYSVFEAMGSNILYEGKAGFGQHTKMANQIAIAGAVTGVAEAIAYGEAAGLDVRTMLDSIMAGAAGSWQMSNNGPKMISEDYAPGFFIKHYIKDMKIAVEEAKARGKELGVLELVLKLYEAMDEMGMGDLGTQAVIEAYRN
ncbi:MAG TPA: oxidoreductase, partial [Lachnospiraceae bacterium]|nr:oxidoreductase [Lachnospiraceae bacterium]